MAIKPVKGSGISTVRGNPVSSYEDANIIERYDRMFNPNFREPRDYNLRPLTTLEKVSRANPKQGILEAFSPLGDAILGRTSNLGIPELRPMTGDRDTVGGELLQGLGNLGLAGLEGLRRTGEIVSETPFAIGRGLATETDSAYNVRMNRLADILDDQTRMQQGQQNIVPSIASSRSVVGGPSYQQTPVDPDQDAAIRSQIADAQRITEEDGIFGDIRQPGMGIPDFVGGVPAAQAEEAARTAVIEAGKDPEDQMFLGKADAPPPASKQETTSGGKAVKGADNSVKQSTVAAIDDVLRQVKPDAKPKDMMTT